MRRLLTAIQWDLLRQQRYQVVTATVFITVLYVLVLLNLPMAARPALLITLIFNDPAGLGMLFIGSLYLMERGEGAVQALSVTPLPPGHYLLSKTITLNLLLLFSSVIMAISGYGWSFHYGYLVLGVGLSASLFTLLGFGLVQGCRSFNEYILKMGLMLTPVILPFLNLFGVTDTLWWYLIPSQAGLLLMERAFAPVAAWKLAYAIGYLLLWNALLYRWALQRFKKALAAI